MKDISEFEFGVVVFKDTRNTLKRVSPERVIGKKLYRGNSIEILWVHASLAWGGCPTRERALSLYRGTYCVSNATFYNTK